MTVITDNRLGEHQAPSVKLSNQPAARPYALTQPVLGDNPFSVQSGRGRLIPFYISLRGAELSETTLHRQQEQFAFAFRTGRKSHPVLYLS
jgi:hypothetical protein